MCLVGTILKESRRGVQVKINEVKIANGGVPNHPAQCVRLSAGFILGVVEGSRPIDNYAWYNLRM